MENITKRTVLVVEHRDEVFARLLYDLSALGLNVERAATVQEASDKFGNSQSKIVLMNREFSHEERGWHLIAKWSLKRQSRRLWLYTARPTVTDVQWAEFVKVEKLLYYAGDLWRLTAQITELLNTEYRPLRSHFNPCLTQLGDKSSRRWGNATRYARRAVALACAAVLLAITISQHSTAKRVVIHLKSLCCQCCTSRALTELACLQGVSRSWVDKRENSLLVEIEKGLEVSPRKIWETIESTHLEPESLSAEQETFWLKPLR